MLQEKGRSASVCMSAREATSGQKRELGTAHLLWIRTLTPRKKNLGSFISLVFLSGSVLCLCAEADVPKKCCSISGPLLQIQGFEISLSKVQTNRLVWLTACQVWTSKLPKFYLFFTKTLSVLLESQLLLQLALFRQAAVIFTGINEFHIHVLRAELKTLFVFPSASVILSELCGNDSWYAFGEALYKMYSAVNQMLKGTAMWQASSKLTEGMGRL